MHSLIGSETLQGGAWQTWDVGNDGLKIAIIQVEAIKCTNGAIMYPWRVPFYA